MTIIEIREKVLEVIKEWSHAVPKEVVELPMSGSNRKYFRVNQDSESVIATYNEDITENRAFFYLTEKLNTSGVNAPKVLHVDKSEQVYIQTDLGNVSLFDRVTDTEITEEEKFEYYKKVIEQMPQLQHTVAQDLDFSVCYPREAFDRQSIQWDLNYFKYSFLKLVPFPFDEQKLEDDFQVLISFLEEAPSDFFLFRDFQSRNIMLLNNDVYFIDYQGGRRGALQYDLASLLYESKVNLSDEFRSKVLQYYLKVFNKFSFFNPSVFLKYYPAFSLIRLLQAFGAYGYRGLFEKKAFFVKSILLGLDNLKSVFADEKLQKLVPYIYDLTTQLQAIRHRFAFTTDSAGLTIHVSSFSYRKGYPDDWSGNGGGYVFDCRALPNPGRQEQYRSNTGRDANVIEFFEKEETVSSFITGIQQIINPSVQEYIHRGFTSLSVSFGCTGGQHRSVYMAEQIAKYLQMNFAVNLRLSHREQNIEEYHEQDNVQEKH